MARKQAIKLKIAGKSYSFTLTSETDEEQSLADKEELYRLAEREVNAYVTRFEKAKYEEFSVRDCLAMTALQLAISNVSFVRGREVGDEDLKRLEAISSRIDGYLNRIDRESKR
ncbi:MAG: cell division protein ZapA [Alistipes sp.]|nr:cell division protein ZapA [Alistipes sp.]MDE7069713.1 cell division protein ZapA [Alistipes sp.]